MIGADRFDVAAARAEMARIDKEWCDARQRGVRNALMALLEKALGAIDAGWPTGSLGTITDAMVEEAALKAWRAVGGTDSTWRAASENSRTVSRSEALAVLEYAASLAQLEIDREERLTRYRCALLSAQVSAFQGTLNHHSRAAIISDEIEKLAHAMLAAEKPAMCEVSADPLS